MSLLLVLLLCACSTSGDGIKWQEQYDLGVRYLDEGNYEEAIIAFTAAIEIDPKRPEAYVGAATAYTSMGEWQLATEMLDKAESILGENDVISAAREELGLLGTSTASNPTVPLNAYGVAEFTYRESYVPFENLSAEKQSWLGTAIAALEMQDKDALLVLCGQIGTIDLDIYTTYGKYRVRVEAGGQSIRLELRPENGMGYWCWTQIIDDGYDHNIVSCPCADWQWNGDAEYYRAAYAPNDDCYLYEDRSFYRVVNSLRDDHETEKITWNHNGWTSSEERTAEYSQGIKISSQYLDRSDGTWHNLGSGGDFVYGAWCVSYGDLEKFYF